MQVMDRDVAIVSCVHELRFATREQIQALLFSPSAASSCKRRLTLLYHNRFLDRRLLPLRSAFGANRAAYCLDVRGRELLQVRLGQPVPWRQRDKNQEHFFLEHLLASNDFRVLVTRAARHHGFQLDWTDERELRTRAFKLKSPGFIPDGHFLLSTGIRQHGFALELDRATVEEKRFKQKILGLQQWKASGGYARMVGTESLRILFVVTDNQRDRNRLARIKTWSEAAGGQNLFWFAHLSELRAESLFTQSIWQVAGRRESYPLFAELPP
jgi:hypothetical protein